MALSSRELYLVLRAKNEATAALNAMGRDLERAAASAELMGLKAQKANLMAEQASQRAAKAQAEYTLRQLESQKASAQQAAATEQARLKTIEYANSMNTAQKATEQQRLSVLQQQQAVDRNVVSLLQNAKAQNELNIQQLRAVPGNDENIRAMRASNAEMQQQIINTRESIIGRQNEINTVRDHINVTQQQINTGRELAQNQQAVVLGARDSARSYDEQITRQRDVVAGMRAEIADRQNLINSTNQEIAKTREANEQRALARQKMRDMGESMMTAGTQIAIGGAVGIAGIVHLTGVAADYEKQTAKTLTQTQGLGTNLKQLGDIGLDVAQKFGVPFDEIQSSLYDIFSSMDVSVPQAQMLLQNFAKAAVAGTTDVRTAGDATIAIMNAYHIPVTGVTKVLDEQFQTVKLGRVEYEQLSGSIGRAIPSAQRAGQSFSVLGGMIALMTRNGATASQAVTSAGRAMDLFANSTVGERLAKIGVQTRDAAGNFRPLTAVVLELRQKLDDLSPQKRAAELDALFKGSGNNIQARRFVDLIANSDQAAKSFKSFADQIQNSGGQMETAYGTMADTVSNKSQLLKNNFHVLEIQLGNALLPVLTQMAGGLSKLVTWFENLSPNQQKFLVWAIAIASALAVVVGVLTAMAGAMLVLTAALGTTIGLIGAVIVVVLAFIAIWVLAYEKVGWFHDAVNAYWHGIATAAKWLWDQLVSIWNGIIAMLQGAWHDIQTIYNGIVAAGKAVADAGKWLWDQMVTIWHGIQSVIGIAWDVILGIFNTIVSVLRTILTPAFTVFQSMVQNVWIAVRLAIDLAWAYIQVVWGLIQIGIKVLGMAFQDFLDNTVRPVWNFVKSIISAAWTDIQNIWNMMISFIKGPLAAGWNWFYDVVVKPLWDKIKAFLSGIWDGIRETWNGIISFIKGPMASGWNWFYDSVVQPLWSRIKDFLNTVWNGGIKPLWDAMVTFLKVDIPTGFRACVSAVESAWGRMKDVAAIPVRFVVNTVLNDGILAAYNKLASTFNVKPDNVHVSLPFAEGGPVWGPGGPKSDLIPAMLSNGEHVWTAAEVQAAGGQAAVAKLRRAVLNRSPDADMLHRAAGGPIAHVANKLGGVGRDVTMVKGAQGGPFDFLIDIAKSLNPVSLLDKALGVMDNVPNAAGAFSRMAVGAGKKVGQGIIDWVRDKIVALIAPAGAGDLSGPQGNSIARILQWARMFYPGAMVSSGYRPGANDYHGMGLAADLIGGGAAGMNTIAAGFYGMSGRLLEEIHSGGPGYAVKNGVRVDGPSFYRSVWADHANHVHIAATNQALADRGGLIKPGMNLIHNMTGGTERILSLAQTQSFDRLVGLLDQERNGVSGGALNMSSGGRSGRPVVVNVYTNELDPRRNAMMLGVELSNQIG